jgi:hypothetical protein
MTALETYLVPPESIVPPLPTRSGGIPSLASDRTSRTQGEVFAAAVQIRNRILYTYRTHQGREQWLHLEAERLGNDPDKGTILRQLRTMLPTGLHDAANREIDRFGAVIRSQQSSSVETGEVPAEPQP